MKNNIYSSVTLILGLTVLLNPIPWIDNSYTEKFDDTISGLTNYKWMWASIDINYAISLLIPFTLLFLSIFFAVKGLKSSPTESKTQRMLSVIMVTISVGVLLSIIGTSIYLWLVI